MPSPPRPEIPALWPSVTQDHACLKKKRCISGQAHAAISFWKQLNIRPLAMGWRRGRPSRSGIRPTLRSGWSLTSRLVSDTGRHEFLHANATADLCWRVRPYSKAKAAAVPLLAREVVGRHLKKFLNARGKRVGRMRHFERAAEFCTGQSLLTIMLVA